MIAGASGWESEGSDKSQEDEEDEDSHKPYAGYRRTNSFDR